jgi:hypothetical protein
MSSENLVIPTINSLHLGFSNHMLNDQTFSFLVIFFLSGLQVLQVISSSPIYILPLSL